MTVDPEGPIFVVGLGRTGTTLLARMLDRHPHLSIYLESGFLNALPPGGASVTLATDAEVARVLDRVGVTAGQGITREDVLRRFAATDRSARALFDTLLRLRMEHFGKRRFGEKTPSHFTAVDTLRAWYPAARFVYLHRDPRDAWASFTHSRDHRARLGRADRTLVGRSLYWNLYRDALAAAKRRFPERINEVELTALVRDPEATLRAVCDFLGEPYDAGMLAVAENNSSFAATRGAAGLRPEVLDRQATLGRAATTAIELLCGAHMRAHGLPLSTASRRIVPLLTRLGFYAGLRRLHRVVRARRGPRHS